MPPRITTILFLLFIPFASYGQDMTMYVIPPAIPMNWHSPRTLFFSYVDNYLIKNKYHHNRHAMGHVMIELKDATHYAIAGVEATSKHYLAWEVYARGYGLGILFAPLEGKMIEGLEYTNQLISRYPNGDVAFIKFKLNSKAFERLWQYLEGYKERGYDKIYNGDNNPREGKGAGCSAFSVSFIELGGLMTYADMAPWRLSVNVPCKLVGGPDGNSRWVGLHKIIFRNKWADTAKQAYRTKVYYEPTAMYNWIQAEWASNGITTRHGYGKELRDKAKGIVIDCTQKTVPYEPTWINE